MLRTFLLSAGVMRGNRDVFSTTREPRNLNFVIAKCHKTASIVFVRGVYVVRQLQDGGNFFGLSVRQVDYFRDLAGGMRRIASVTAT
jgi:hypothetical protein